MTEESEKMLLLLKELALLKQSESEPDPAEPGLPRSLASRKIKEITREMKRLARATKNKSRKH